MSSRDRPAAAPDSRREAAPLPLALRSLPASVAVSAGVVAVFLIALLGLVCLLVWATDAQSGGHGSGPAAASGALLALAHHGTVRAGDARFSVPPLGLTAVCVLLLSRSVRSVLLVRRRTSPDLRREAATACAVTATVWCAVVTTWVALTVPDVSLAEVAAGALVVGAAAAGLAVRSVHRPALPVALGAAARATRLLVAAGALLVLVLVGTHLGQASAVQASLGAGVVGSVALLVGQLLYLPTLVLWSTSALLGTGFSLGTGTHVGPGTPVLGQLPAVPVLAAVPSSVPGAAWLLLLLGPLAGAVAVRAVPAPDLRSASRTVAATAGWTVLLVAAGAVVAQGALGPGRLQHVGPSVLVTGLAAGLEVGLGCAVVLLLRGRAAARGTVATAPELVPATVEVVEPSAGAALADVAVEVRAERSAAA